MRDLQYGVRMHTWFSPSWAVRVAGPPESASKDIRQVLPAAGVIVGSGASLAVVRLLQSFLWGVTPSDPLTFITVVLTLLTAALLASLVPILRVLRLDPASTLRAE